MLKILFASFSLLVGATAHASIDFVISPSLSIKQQALSKDFSKASQTTTVNGTTGDAQESDLDYKLSSSAQVTSINLGIGLGINGWLFAGLKVLSESGGTSANSTNVVDGFDFITASSSNDSDVEKTFTTATSGVGLQFGFLPKENFYFLVSYMVSLTRANEFKYKSNETGTESSFTMDESEGSGLIVDFGWRFRMGAFGLGPQITYKSLSFKKETWKFETTSASSEIEYTVATTETSLEPYLGIWLQF